MVVDASRELSVYYSELRTCWLLQKQNNKKTKQKTKQNKKHLLIPMIQI